MVKSHKGKTMTKKMTITLEESLIDELSELSKEMGKKKTQIIREALQDYFDTQAITRSVTEYKLGQLKPLSHDEVKAALGL
jgi:predicted DNA-binding protein